MAKRHAAGASCLPRLAPLAAAALLAMAPAHAQLRIAPTVGGTETYTDNVNLASDGHAKGQYVSDARAGLEMDARSERLNFAGAVEAHQFLFARGGMPNTKDHQLVYRLAGQASIIDDLLYLDAAASGGPQVVSAFGPQLNNNLYAMGNRADVRTWRISPYLKHRFGRSTETSLRYTRDSVDAGANNPFGSSTGSSVAANLASGSNADTLGWGLNYMRQDLENRLAGPSSSETALGNLSLRLFRTFSLTASGGYDKYDYRSLGGRSAGRNWSAGFIWAPSARTRVQASAGRHFFGKTGAFEASHRSRHTVWSAHYSDAVTSTRAQFLLPSTVDTATMLDNLFAATIPDPVARAQAVANYMLATGLPPTLPDNVNYMSNRYMRQKDFRLSGVLRGAHSDLLISLFDTKRVALSDQQSDSGLLGTSLLNLNDSTHQRGVNTVWGYRVSSRDTANLTATFAHVESLSTGYVSHNVLLRAGLTRRFSNRLYGMVEVRHAGGGAGVGQSYRENAVSATLSMQL